MIYLFYPKSQTPAENYGTTSPPAWIWVIFILDIAQSARATEHSNI